VSPLDQNTAQRVAAPCKKRWLQILFSATLSQKNCSNAAGVTSCIGLFGGIPAHERIGHWFCRITARFDFNGIQRAPILNDKINLVFILATAA